MWFLVLPLIVIAITIAIAMTVNATPEERETWAHGDRNPAMVCPHCKVVGKVRTKSVIQKKGVSGGRATAAILTGGVSLVATGLSRKEQGTQAYCENCRNTWLF